MLNSSRCTRREGGPSLYLGTETKSFPTYLFGPVNYNLTACLNVRRAPDRHVLSRGEVNSLFLSWAVASTRGIPNFDCWLCHSSII